MKVTLVQREYLIRTLVLNLATCIVTIVIARACFESEADFQFEIYGLAISLLIGLVGGWFFVIRPVGKIIRNLDRQSESDFGERFASMVESMQEGVIIYDRTGVVSWNSAVLRKLEVSEKEMGRNLIFGPSLLVISEDGSPLLETDRSIKQCFRSGHPHSEIIGLQRSDGRSRWLRIQTSPIFATQSDLQRKSGQHREVRSVIATFRDITAERGAAERFELALKAVKLGVWEMDLVSGVLSWDETMCRIYGLEPVALQRDVNFFEKFIVDVERDQFKRAFELAVAECRDFSTEFRIQIQSGETRIIRFESKGFYTQDGMPLRQVGVNWDVTAQREQELRTIQASKMSTLGEMSAGLAHEINNPLAIIMGKTEAMRTAMAAPVLNRELMNRHIETMERTANRIANIVKALRTYSRDGSADPFEVISVRDLVNEVATLCSSRFLNHGIELHVPTVPIEMTIDARSVQLSQVLLNLLHNAFDAASALEEKWVRLEVSSDGPYIEFTVTDSGTGIPDEIRAKLIQPFFTTKAVGAGAGLGLSIASGIVNAHGGTLDVDTNSPNTRFVVRIPRSRGHAATIAA